MKIIKYLLEKFYIQTMYIIMGFTLGSIFILFPEINTLVELIITLMCMGCGYLVMNIVSNK